MKHSSLFTVFGIFCFQFLLFTTIQASSINLSSVKNNIRVGETYTLSVVVDPDNQKVFTVKTILSYPPDMLRLSTFTFDDMWTPLNQPGYNEINNENGTLIKTGGYPSGFSSRTTFGVIKFIGLKEGNATVSVVEGSQVFDSESKNTLLGNSRAVLAISATINKTEKTIKTNSVQKIEKPITKTESGLLIPERYEIQPLPSEIPSPDKTWLYIKLAFFSLTILLLKYKWILFIVTLLLFYILFRLVSMKFRN